MKRTLYHIFSTDRQKDALQLLSMWQVVEKYGHVQDKSKIKVIVYEGELGSEYYSEKWQTTLDNILK